MQKLSSKPAVQISPSKYNSPRIAKLSLVSRTTRNSKPSHKQNASDFTPKNIKPSQLFQVPKRNFQENAQIPVLALSKIKPPSSSGKHQLTTTRAKKHNHTTENTSTNSSYYASMSPMNSTSRNLSKARQHVSNKSETHISTSSLLKSSKRKYSENFENPKELWSQSELPITSAGCLKRFSACLTSYEQSEILSYKEIYCIGIRAKKLKGSTSSFMNYGYDDEKGNYKVVIGDHIAYRYEIISLLGRGSFGQVCKAFDHKRKEMVALKIIKNKKKIIYQAGVEISVLCKLRELEEESKYVVQLKNYFLFRKHVCLVFELLNVDLYDFMKKNQFRGCSLKLIKRFAYQILACLRVLKTKNIIHCDLKPENILLCNSSKSQIKLIDFGSSCFTEEQLYTYIQSRFYRAPEIMLGIRYTHAIDMWSFGCILAELYTGIPLFPGETEAQQMLRIMELTGPPPAHVLERSTRKHHFFDQEGKPKLVPNKKGIVRFPGTKKLSTLIGCADEDFLDLVSKCLNWDPETRLKPSEALGHRFIVVS
mmetsp:Transcript_12485/g.18192  ORF Transcript_12485/g.18192 Transcript_12485/m.18192 type:complete len:537 (-) Transcript_12485:979-2589(-)